MNPKNPVNAEELKELAKNSTDQESYRTLCKAIVYHIGVGARVTPPNASFFIEVIVNLSDQSKKVDLNKLENILNLLRILQARKYSLTYEDDNCIQCETMTTSQNLNKEYAYIKSLTKTKLS